MLNFLILLIIYNQYKYANHIYRVAGSRHSFDIFKEREYILHVCLSRCRSRLLNSILTVETTNDRGRVRFP